MCLIDISMRHESLVRRSGWSEPGRRRVACEPRMRTLSGVLCGVMVLLMMSAPGKAQFVSDGIDQLDFDDPEAWAMKYFSSISLTTGLGPVERSEKGSVELGLELMQSPDLSAEEQRVGFDGAKEEDLNRTPAWARFRARFGLPAGFSAGFGVVPPVEVEGVEAALISVFLERPLVQRERWGLGARMFAQVGMVDGDFTCKGSEIGVPGSPADQFGCEAASTDEVTLDHRGLELNLWREVGRSGRRSGPVLHAGISVQEHDLEFQVNARTFGFIDRTLLLADGSTVSYTVGATFELAEKLKLGTELFYTPLDVRRLDLDSFELGPVQNDALLNLRLLLRYRLR